MVMPSMLSVNISVLLFFIHILQNVILRIINDCFPVKIFNFLLAVEELAYYLEGLLRGSVLLYILISWVGIGPVLIIFFLALEFGFRA